MNAEDRMDAMLDHALEMTFPVSDPFSIYVPETESGNDEAILDSRASRACESSRSYASRSQKLA